MTRTDLKAFYFLNVQGCKSFFNTQETNQRISHFVMHLVRLVVYDKEFFFA